MSEVFSFSPPPACEKPYSVSEINAGIARILEAGNTLVWVEGEISNFKHASSGHCYLKLKDSESQVPAVLWRSAAAKLTFEPEEGMAVTVIASIRVYQKGGYYQLDIHRMQPAGVGALFAAFEKLKKRLEAEGLFDPAHKKPLPKTVRILGVITSKSGAAIRDIIKVVANRAPQTTIVLYDVAVQGEKAPAQIAAAIRALNEYGKPDCIIVGRGGGSVEDLWAFNDEAVARAIYESEIPIVSAVGHEIDFTIADFVADARAPTPSAAAEMVVSDQRENQRYVQALGERFSGAVQRYFSAAYRAFRELAQRPALRTPLRRLADTRQQIDELRDRQVRAMGFVLEKRRLKMSASAAKLEALSPLSVLGRGFSVVQKQDGTTVRKSSQLKIDEMVQLRFHSGGAEAQVRSLTHP